MKCNACGYEFEEEWVKEKKTVMKVKGDEKFLKIEGMFMTSDYYETLHQVSLYACPKCNVVSLQE